MSIKATRNKQSPALFILLLVLSFTLLLPACEGSARQIPYRGIYNFKVLLENNPDAKDPTYEEVKTFLHTDTTDERDYVEKEFVCGAFAQEVHNNAEKAGIKAAWVAINLAGKTVGHALNAFNTTDRGLIFTDSTGDTAEVYSTTLLKPESDDSGNEPSIKTRDRIAYVVKGKELGFISIDIAESPGYVYYEQYCLKRQEYDDKLNKYNNMVQTFNSEVQQYNNWISGKIFTVGSSEARKADNWRSGLQLSLYQIKSMKADLDKEKSTLGAFWKPMGTVADIDIRW
ncbi:MAG: hypothetical protein NT082_03435 [Chloroflexi bacterium]|nr:hypothetical protein [Chloroflexota bacterium]